MAKGFPYFKFFPTEWMTGDIVYESFEVQGLFINICALYWQRDGKVSLDDIKKRFKSNSLKELTDRFFSVSDGFISISFLDEQLKEAGHISSTNSQNGKLGGRPKKNIEEIAKVDLKETDIDFKSENKPTAFDSLSETKAKKSKEELELELEEEKELKKSKIIEEYRCRKLKFSATLEPFLDKYGREMLNDFYKYWTEPNKSGTKFRKEGEKFWDLEKRLNTWAGREKNNFNGKIVPIGQPPKGKIQTGLENTSEALRQLLAES